MRPSAEEKRREEEREKKGGMEGATGLESSDTPKSVFILMIVDETGTPQSRPNVSSALIRWALSGEYVR